MVSILLDNGFLKMFLFSVFLWLVRHAGCKPSRRSTIAAKKKKENNNTPIKDELQPDTKVLSQLVSSIIGDSEMILSTVSAC